MDIKQELIKRGLPTEGYPALAWNYPYGNNTETRTDYPIEQEWLIQYVHNKQPRPVIPPDSKDWAKEFEQTIDNQIDKFNALVNYIRALDQPQLAKFLELFAEEFYERGKDLVYREYEEE